MWPLWIQGLYTLWSHQKGGSTWPVAAREATSAETWQSRPGGARTRFSPRGEVRSWGFTCAVVSLRSQAPRRDPARGVPVVYIPRSRLVRGPAGHPGCYPGLRRGHVLLHGRSRPSSADSRGKLRRRCLGTPWPGRSFVGAPRGSLPAQTISSRGPLTATEADDIPSRAP